tara:strand:- start:12825 stop:14225 length:1401 start_codon:yes stop_codon:yes gene_type:complete
MEASYETREGYSLKHILVKNGRIVDPSQELDTLSNLLITDGVVSKISSDIDSPDGAHVIDAKGLVITPGFIDIHCHLRQPGFEDKETIATGTEAAVRGGFTTVCAMPNTNPPTDTRATVDFINRVSLETGVAQVLPIGCITKGSLGLELSEMGELAEAGVVGFSDDGHPVANPNIMRQALSYSLSHGLPIINHCESLSLSQGGVMNEGWISNRLGLKGIPTSAEATMVSRDIALAKLTGGRLHIAHMSTEESVEIIASAKSQGIRVTCEVTPHHLTLSDESVLGRTGNIVPNKFDALTQTAYDTNAKVNPPLRTDDDVQAMVQALKNGIVDFIATDHAPHNEVGKLCTFDEADFGISGLETAFGSVMSLAQSDKMGLSSIIEKLTIAPAKFLIQSSKILDNKLGTLQVGAPGDVAVFDPDEKWIVDPNQFASKGKNTPLDGSTLTGKIKLTIVRGTIQYSDLKNDD